ncbi:MAG TPA: ATP-NAD kinase family protein [Candidatus Thermoplasmatota archaeon]|nr:ATP-NAD kinase family protein [Candidatus Thermoplasmatota archaeon]
MKIGFIVNPIAGMGGRVGLKGTDGVYGEAVNRGAHPVASEKALIAIKTLIEEYPEVVDDITWLSCSGAMGIDILLNAGINEENIQVVYTSESNEMGKTSTKDTVKACAYFIDEKVDLLVFCGGDGTARDIVSKVKKSVPILGIPSGVKMHSGVFAITAHAAGPMIARFVKGELRTGDAEIMDLDETLYRKGTWKVRLYNTARGINEPTYVQVGKASFAQINDDEIKNDITEHIEEELDNHSDTLYLFGSGGTIDYIASKLSIENTILGIDAIYKKKNIGKDVNEKQLLTIMGSYDHIKVILSPIGAQGFIFGRGNLQLSPKIIKKIGIDNIIVVSTPSKLKATPVLRVDTGDEGLDKEFVDYEMILVVIGYRMSRVVHITSV